MYCVKVPQNGKVVVVGDIHEHEEQVDKLLSTINPSPEMILVSIGDIYEKGFGTKSAETIVNKFRKLSENGSAYVVRGNHELKCIKTAQKDKQITKCLSWINKQPLSIIFEFYNRTRLVVIHGGVRPTHTLDDISTDIEVCYMRNLDKQNRPIKRVKNIVNGVECMVDQIPGGRVWHEVYDGRFGYIASGHNAQKDGVCKFYNYSCNLDSAVYCTGKLSAQVFSERGKEKLFTFEGKAKYPNL